MPTASDGEHTSLKSLPIHGNQGTGSSENEFRTKGLTVEEAVERIEAGWTEVRAVVEDFEVFGLEAAHDSPGLLL